MHIDGLLLVLAALSAAGPALAAPLPAGPAWLEELNTIRQGLNHVPGSEVEHAIAAAAADVHGAPAKPFVRVIKGFSGSPGAPTSERTISFFSPLLRPLMMTLLLQASGIYSRTRL